MSVLIPTDGIFDASIEDHIKSAFADYAMSVITQRAIPDIRDGLKPVHRRILYAMWELHLTANAKTVKSAKIVGDTLGNLHPHGDSACYDAAVIMAQPWSLLHPLIDGQGNFGSIANHPAASMRYTEMRLTRIAETFFEGIGKSIVPMVPNYDGRQTEPTALPILWPHMLVNGTSGIAVGMATYIPPHNLGEVIGAYLEFIKNPDISIAEIMSIMPAPDFPTGGIVHGLGGYAEAVETGRGKVRLRTRWHEDTGKRGATTLVIDEVPYEQNTTKIIESMVQAIEEKKVDDIDHVESSPTSKEPVKIVVYLRPGTSAEVAFNQFVTACEGLETSISYNLTSIVDGEPKTLGFRDVFAESLKFALRCVTRETQFDLDKSQARLHILHGLMAAVGKLDEVIATIRGSADGPQAKAAIVAMLGIDEEQAQAILDMRLQKLTGLEIDGLKNEYDSLVAAVSDFEDILAKESRRIGIVVERVGRTAAKFARERRTTVSHDLSRVSREDLIEEENVVIISTKDGYIKRVPVKEMSRQGRGTRGKSWMTTGDKDFITALHPASTHDYLMCLTESGMLLTKKAFYIPESGSGTKGRHISNVFDGLDDRIVNLMSATDFDEDKFLVTISAQGNLKRTALSEYVGSTKKGGVTAVKIEDGDRIVAVDVCREWDHVMLIASNGRAVRFVVDEKQMRPMGRHAVGTRGMSLALGESIVGMTVLRGDGNPQAYRDVRQDDMLLDGLDQATTTQELDTDAMDDGNYLLCIGQNGFGKCTRTNEYTARNRAGKGVDTFNITKKTGPLIAALGVRDDQDLVFITANGISNRIHVADIRTTRRNAGGNVSLMNVDKNDKVVDVAKVVRAEDPEGTEEEAE